MEEEAEKEVAVAVEKRLAVGKIWKKHVFHVGLYEQETQLHW